MNKKLTEALADLENMLQIQRTFAEDTDKAGHSSADYHQGLYNGLAISYAIFDGKTPICYNRKYYKKKPKHNIRHKGKK